MTIRSEHEPLAVGVADAAKMTGLSRSRLYQLMSAGDLRGLRVGSRRLFRVDALRDLLDRAEAA